MIFHHVALNCKDTLVIEQFYAKHFGFQRARKFDIGLSTPLLFVKRDDVYLELYPVAEDRPGAAPPADGYTYPGVRHIAFKVDNVDAKLAEMGADAVIMHGPIDYSAFIPSWRTVWVADPEGNIVEISQGYLDEA
jgi:glyoxylase I family protein